METAIARIGDYLLDFSDRTLVSPDQVVRQLTGKQLAALVYMVENPGRLLSKEELLGAIWKDVLVSENSLNQLISSLRGLFGESAANPHYILTVPRAGYRLNVPAWFVADNKRTTPDKPLLAILSFENIGEFEPTSHFARGIREELYFRFSRLSGLRIVGKSTSDQLPRFGHGTRHLYRQLGIHYILTGSVRADRGRLRASVQLIQVSSNEQVLADQFDSSTDDVIHLQEQIAARVASALQLKLGLEIHSPAEPCTNNPAAYDAYLRARAMEGRGGPNGMIEAAKLYRNSVSIDPDFAAAWSGLAEALRGILIFAPQLYVETARELKLVCNRLEEVAPQSWFSQSAIYWRASLEYDWCAMKHSLVTAQRMAPGMPVDLDFRYAAFYSHIGQINNAITCYRNAILKDPLSLLLSGLYQKELDIAGRHTEADIEYQRSQDLPGDRAMTEHIALQRTWLTGDKAAEHEIFEKFLHCAPPLSEIFKRIHENRDSPLTCCELLRRMANSADIKSGSQLVVIAWWLAHFGEADSSLNLLEKAYMRTIGAPVNWLWMAVLREVRQLPGFRLLLDYVGLLHYWERSGTCPDSCLGL